MRVMKLASIMLLMLSIYAAMPGRLAAGVIFSDDFNSGPSSLWNNQSNSWSVSGGQYSSPPIPNGAHTLLPFALWDFNIDVDIQDVDDGGIWLRAAPSSSNIGVQGVLLVTGATFTGRTGFYFHIVPDGPGAPWGLGLNPVFGLFQPGDDIHVRVTVRGDTYSVFLNGGSSAVTSLTTSQFATGRVGLYNNSLQTFDNVVVDAVPEPGAGALVAAGLGLVTLRRLRRRSKGRN